MFLRDIPTETLTDLKDKLDTRSLQTAINATDINIDHVGREIRLGQVASVPMTNESLSYVGEFLGVPAPWIKKEDNDIVATVLNMKAQRSHHPIVVRYLADEAIMSIREPGAKVIEPRQLIDVAAHVLTPDAQVIDFINSTRQFGLDVVVHDGSDRGIGGDIAGGGPQNRKVGDLTKGGLRFGQDVHQNLAPWVQPYTYRLACTNGMEIPDNGLKIDARGNTVEEVLLELEAAAERAMSRVERDIEHFYAMREEKVANPERALARMAAEHGLSDRLRVSLIDGLPGIIEEGAGDLSMFDLVNLTTNLANDPSISNWGTRRNLQRFGGQTVTTHVERCNTCASKLTR